ncbi:MAG: response regulator [Candidatus Rokuibacteriota bacterium]|nr:MAG: response regulator [Candidatus Rokubacteria bacterium]
MEATTPRRLLLIDDEAMVRTMLTDVLESFGYRVDAAESGEAALERFHAGQYDAVITDLVMPGMNGLEAAERLREFDSVVPVILLTGSAGASAVHEARRAGLKVVYKPVSLSGLKAVVETACEQTA